ncbi:MAG: hypothetical protein V4651_10755 [Bacteroidota bacterium]
MSIAKGQADFTAELSALQSAYKNAPSLSFNIQYTYADESSPGIVLDSSLGKFRISRNRYWGYIDSTEFMQNDSVSVVVYKPGKLIHVNTPSDIYPQVTGFASLEMILGKTGYSSSLEYSGRQKVIAITIHESESPYKNFRLFYDSVSHYLTQMMYTVKDEYVSGENNENTSGTYRKYIIVKAEYSDYNTSAFSESTFATGNYFIHTNGKQEPVPPFEGFEVFLSSPKLSSNQQPLH